MGGAKFFAQIHHSHLRERPILHARLQLQQRVFARAGVMITFERRCGGAENHGHAFESRPIDRRIAAVITRRFLLLVTRLLLFIHKNQPEILEWCEHSGSCANHNPSFAATHAPPLPRALVIRKRAVEYSHAGAKPRAHMTAHPQRQRNFGYKHQRASPLRNRCFHSAQINFRLPAASHTMQQANVKRLRINPPANLLERRGLLGI